MKKKIGKLFSKCFPEKWKAYSELRYWKQQREKEGSLSNDHYKFFYTSHFGLGDEFYSGKRILDIGCGPRGSLEWATMAKLRVGLDPLTESYLKLGADHHKMEYCNSPSENIPFDDEYFDVVCAFNSLDHVSNVDDSVSEIKRVTKPAGLFLFLVEINHEPTSCEPHKFSTDILEKFNSEFNCLVLKVFKPMRSGLYNSIKSGKTFDNPRKVTENAWLSAKFRKL